MNSGLKASLRWLKHDVILVWFVIKEYLQGGKNKLHVLEVMAVKPEARLIKFSALVSYFLLLFFHVFKGWTDLPPLMEILIIPDNTDVCLYIKARQ